MAGCMCASELCGDEFSLSPCTCVSLPYFRVEHRSLAAVCVAVVFCIALLCCSLAAAVPACARVCLPLLAERWMSLYRAAGLPITSVHRYRVAVYIESISPSGCCISDVSHELIRIKYRLIPAKTQARSLQFYVRQSTCRFCRGSLT